MALKQSLIKTPPGTEFIEATMIPKTVDIDYYMKRSTADMYSGLKPSLKPLKWSNAIKKNSQRELDVAALEASHKRIIYIRTFNHVKNEAIVTQPDINPAKNTFNITEGFEKKKRGPNGKKTASLSLETRLTISCFKKNKKKFDPTKQIKKKPESDSLRFDENSAPKDFAFLTGVNIQEQEKVKEDKEDDEENDDDEEDYDIIDINEKQNVLRELPANMNRLYESKSRESDRPRTVREENNLPVLRKPWTANSEKPSISASETRYKQYMNQKPKMYISAKANSVQAYGRPSNYKEHLTRVFNKEDTPVIPYGLVDHLGPRKDYRKALLDSYLSQFNLEALKYIDEDLYEYAKQKAAL